MSRYYCFPDIHGCSDALTLALDFVCKQNPEGGKIIFLGDYIDRGPDNLGVLNLVMNPPKNWEFVCLLGNHELMFIDSFLTISDFYDKKAAKQIAKLNPNDFALYEDIVKGIDSKIINWMTNLKLCHIEDKNVFAHAFYDDSLSFYDQVTNKSVWYRMDDHMPFPNEKQGLYLTHGHTPKRNGPILSPNRCNLDAGAVFYGTYIIGEYASGVQGPVDFHRFQVKEYLNF
jgi:serine/threonine protein phosphatase 1